MIDPQNTTYSNLLNFLSRLPGSLSTIACPATIINHLCMAISQIDSVSSDYQRVLVRRNARPILEIIADRAAKTNDTHDLAVLKTGFEQVRTALHKISPDDTVAAVTALQDKLSFLEQDYSTEQPKPRSDRLRTIEPREAACT
jgi:hypothetical protein